MLVEYRSNNSGGSWWLEDKDWKKLEAAGWKVKWVKDEESKLAGWSEVKKTGRWLGALATTATLECETPGDAMRKFEEVTGQDVSDEGCNCCGAPHSFNWGSRRRRKSSRLRIWMGLGRRLPSVPLSG